MATFAASLFAATPALASPAATATSDDTYAYTCEEGRQVNPGYSFSGCTARNNAPTTGTWQDIEVNVYLEGRDKHAVCKNGNATHWPHLWVDHCRLED
ncbi:hypothetical protein [Streptomyces chrestomyceticus]|uniref:hypothetical protein n=1 Tax=Streptomyces chrestomyceticus TaxID=68185 RepID=UPI00379B647A